MTKNRTILFILLLALVLSAAVIGFLFYAFTPPKGDRYYLPELYAGWVCVHYGVTGSPPLSIEDGYLVHKVPLSGIITTSSEPRLSPKRNQYYYYSDKYIRVAKELQEGGGHSKDKGNEYSLYFWVSSGNIESDDEKYVKTRDIDLHFEPECGPWKK